MMAMRMKQPLALLLLAAVALPGCTSLRTPYARPALAVAPQWASASATATSTEQWWKAFGDPELDRLVERVLARNNNLAQAAILLRRARLQVGLAVTNPTVGANLNASGSDALRAGRTTCSASWRRRGTWRAGRRTPPTRTCRPPDCR